MRLGAWLVEKGTAPVRLNESQPNLEEHLEDWIEADSSLVGDGIAIVARQVVLDAGRLDLLGLDTRGRWVVIEIKAGFLYREVIAQALDYVASVESVPPETLRSWLGHRLARPLPDDVRQRAEEVIRGERETDVPVREVVAVIVGTGADAGLERLRAYLVGRHQVPVEVSTLSYFPSPAGAAMVVRELTSSPPPAADESGRYERVLRLADEYGLRDLVTVLIDRTREVGLYPRPYVRSIMPTPPDQRNRGIFVASVRPNGLELWHGAATFVELVPGLTAADVGASLGADGKQLVANRAGVDAFMDRVAGLMVLSRQRSGAD